MKRVSIALVLALIACAAAQAAQLEIPLTVAERAGVDRVGNHVNAGVPFPKGAVADVAKLGLFTEDGKPVPAVFVVRQKWLADNSVRWATVHFLSPAPARGQVKYVVKEAAPAAPAYPIKAEAAADKITVDTGAVKFTVTKNNFNVIDEVWFDPTAQGKYGKPLVESGKAKLVASIASGGTYKVVNVKASPDRVADAADNVAQVAALELEENTPVRAVVKVAGQWMNGPTPTVNFVTRIYAVAGSPAIRVSLSIVNLTAKAWNEFHGFDELSLTVPISTGGPLKYTLSTSEGDDASGAIKPGEKATLLQPYSEHYFLGGAANGQGKAKSILTRRLGWADLTGADAGVAVGIRYFWQMHPKGLAVSGDGSVSAQIVPRQEKAVEVPKGITSQADTRVDLFCGGARTHELLIAFHAPTEKPAPLVMGIVDPLLAACQPSWYCQGSGAEGPLWDASPDNFKPEHRELAAAFQAALDRAFNECAGPVRRAGKRGTEEFGFFSFGAGTEAKDPGYIVKNDWLNTRWDGNYYDFPRAALVNFWRTGNLTYWDVAQDSALHLGDCDIAHLHPGNPKLNGIEHTCPNRGHFRQYWGAEPFGISGNMDSTKSQSLYDVYHMTGDAWLLECGLLVASYNMNHTGGALRAIGNRAKNLFEAYEQTADKKYLDECANWLNRTLVPRGPSRSWDQYWMYGMGSEALMDLYRQTGDAKWAKTTVDCCDSLVNVHWNKEKQQVPNLCGFTVICFGHAYELTADQEYLKKGIKMLEATSKEYSGATKTFAQGYRISPYFLHYLTKDYAPPKTAVEKPKTP